MSEAAAHWRQARARARLPPPSRCIARVHAFLGHGSYSADVNIAVMDVLVSRTAEAIGAAIDSMEPALASAAAAIASAKAAAQPHLAAVEVSARVAIEPALITLRETSAYNHTLETLGPAMVAAEEALGPALAAVEEALGPNTKLILVAAALLFSYALIMGVVRCLCGSTAQRCAREQERQRRAQKGGMGGGGGKQAPPKKKKQKKKVMVRMCKYCEIQIPDEAFVATHLSGKRHKKLAEGIPAEQCWQWVELPDAQEEEAETRRKEEEAAAALAEAAAAAAQDNGEWEEAGAAAKRKRAAKLAAAKKKAQAAKAEGAGSAKASGAAPAVPLRRHPRCADCGARARDGATIETDPDDESRGYCLQCWDVFLNPVEEALAAEEPKLLPKAAGIEAARRAIYASN